MALALKGARALVSNQYDESVTVIDTTTFDVLEHIDVGEYPEGINALPDDRYLYVANWFSNSVSVVDAQTSKVVRSIDVEDGPRAYGNSITGTQR